MKLKIAVFASHGGSNLQAIIDGIKENKLAGTIEVVISNNSNSFALERAKKENIPCYHVSTYKFDDVEKEILRLLHKYDVNIIVLAGYMKKLPLTIIKQYKNHILNIHPALLPKFGGKGMYGLNVHKAVIEKKEKYSGATIHLVDEYYDQGKILNQKVIKVDEKDSPETLAKKVLLIEHKIYLETLIMIANGKIMLK